MKFCDFEMQLIPKIWTNRRQSGLRQIWTFGWFKICPQWTKTTIFLPKFWTPSLNFQCVRLCVWSLEPSHRPLGRWKCFGNSKQKNALGTQDVTYVNEPLFLKSAIRSASVITTKSVGACCFGSSLCELIQMQIRIESSRTLCLFCFTVYGQFAILS